MTEFKDKKFYMFEGCDRTGKSTFINYLFDELKIRGSNPFILHLMGPTKFQGFQFDNDDKSLIQLAKFNDEDDVLREMMMDKSSGKNLKCILDRTSFGEYIWTRYWSRTGKYTDYVTSPEFIARHRDIMNESVYMYFYMSDIDALERRIFESEEDKKIFTIGGRTIKENIQYVYDLYEELNKLVEDAGIEVLRIDASQFKTFEDDEKYVLNLFDDRQ